MPFVDLLTWWSWFDLPSSHDRRNACGRWMTRIARGLELLHRRTNVVEDQPLIHKLRTTSPFVHQITREPLREGTKSLVYIGILAYASSIFGAPDILR